MTIDDRQITHLICVCPKKHLLYDFLRGVLGYFCKKQQQEGGPKHPLKSHRENILGGHISDEKSGGRLDNLGFQHVETWHNCYMA